MGDQPNPASTKPASDMPASLSSQEPSTPAASAPATPSAVSPETPKKKNNTVLIIVIVLVVILLPCCACGALAMFGKSALSDTIRDSINENVSENLFENALEEGLSDGTGEDVDIDLNDDQLTWDTEDGTGSMGTVTEWPDTVPSDVPEFTFGAIDYAYTSDSETGAVWSMTFADSDSNAAASYQALLESAGWTITATTTYEGVTSVSADKGILTVVCSCDSSDDSCSMTVMENVE